MSWYSKADADFDAWVTGNWGEDSVSKDEEEEDQAEIDYFWQTWDEWRQVFLFWRLLLNDN